MTVLTHIPIGPLADGAHGVGYQTPGCTSKTVISAGMTRERAQSEANRLNQNEGGGMKKSTELTPAQNMAVVHAITAMASTYVSETRLTEARRNMIREIRKVNRATSPDSLARLRKSL